MDIADQAEHQEAQQRQFAIRNAKANKGPTLTHTGQCHFCEAEVEAPKLFCDGHCAKRYEHKKGR